MTVTREALLPTGAQHEIAYSDQRAVVTEVGATLRSYEAAGVAVVDGFPADESSAAGRGQVLAPWPNRLEDGTYSYGGVDVGAALDEPERANAIHGLVRWRPWTLDIQTDAAVALRCMLHPLPGYPWLLEIGVRYELDANGLTVEADATNHSTETAPFGIGFHPYVTVGTERIDDAHLTVPAGEQLVADGRGLAVLEHPDGARAVRVWADPAFRYLMVYTGDTLEPAERRRAGIAIEPMTCPPNALRTGVDLIE